MGRGAQAQTQKLTDQQLAGINALNQQLVGNQQQVGNLLVPQFKSIANNPGLSPADKAAVTAQSQGALGSAFDALQQSAANRAARTRNSAGFADLADELPRQRLAPQRIFLLARLLARRHPRRPPRPVSVILSVASRHLSRLLTRLM